MPRYSLRTLMILLAVGPPVLAYWWWAGVAWSNHPAGLLGFALITLGMAITLLGAIGQPDF